MSSSIFEMTKRVDARLRRISADYGEERPASDVAFLCSGTDVRGPQLEQRLGRDLMELRALVAKGAPVEETIMGMLVRMFWLGFEYGREEPA